MARECSGALSLERRFRSLLGLDRLRVLVSMKGQAGKAEGLTAQIATVGMHRTERCTAVVAERLCIARARCALLVMHTAHLDDSAVVVIHRTKTISTLQHSRASGLGLLGAVIENRVQDICLVDCAPEVQVLR